MLPIARCYVTSARRCTRESQYAGGTLSGHRCCAARNTGTSFYTGRPDRRGNRLLAQGWRTCTQTFGQRGQAVADLTRGIELTRLLPDSPARDHRELRFDLALGPAMRAIKGHATVEVLAVYSRARELLNDAASSREQMSVLYGLWIAHFTRWDTATRELAQEMIALAERHKDVEARELCG